MIVVFGVIPVNEVCPRNALARLLTRLAKLARCAPDVELVFAGGFVRKLRGLGTFSSGAVPENVVGVVTRLREIVAGGRGRVTILASLRDEMKLRTYGVFYDQVETLLRGVGIDVEIVERGVVVRGRVAIVNGCELSMRSSVYTSPKPSMVVELFDAYPDVLRRVDTVIVAMNCAFDQTLANGLRIVAVPPLGGFEPRVRDQVIGAAIVEGDGVELLTERLDAEPSVPVPEV